MAANLPPADKDVYTSQIFGQDIAYQKIDPAKHKGYHQAMFVRAEMCAACHDVTNALPIKNPIGKWVGGFPIERTYTEWANSAYADRPGNKNFDPKFKRDCQSCHMQQDYGQPGTAQTLYKDGKPLPPPVDRVANEGGSPHPFFTHHFVGGNAYVPGLIGKDVDSSGNIAPYPELSAFSFSSADEKSPYSRGFWTHVERKGAYSQQARLAWDRLRHVLSMELHGPEVAAGKYVLCHSPSPLPTPAAATTFLPDFLKDEPPGWRFTPTIWPRAKSWRFRTTSGIACRLEWATSRPRKWSIPTSPAATGRSLPDPRIPIPCSSRPVASLGDGCPTLDLPYATPLNLVTNKQGLPIDKDGKVIDRNNSTSLPQFKDNDGNGDFFDDSFLRDTRFKPRGRPEYEKRINRYEVVIPVGIRGPVAVSATIYYQSVEAVVALHFLGNMADTNQNFILEPCVLGGLCDGRKPSTEPPVVEGAPPVPMAARSWLISIDGAPKDRNELRVATYPQPGARAAYHDTVVKVFFSAPVRGVDNRSFVLSDSRGTQIPAWVDQIGDGIWGLFPNSVILKPGETYTARLKAGICDLAGNCTRQDTVWKFSVSKEPSQAAGDTSIPVGFRLPEAHPQTPKRNNQDHVNNSRAAGRKPFPAGE